MRWLRFFVAQALSAGAQVAVEDGARHHMAQVLRLRVGDKLILFNGDGYDYHGTVQHLDRKQLLVAIERAEYVMRESPLNLQLYLCLLKNETMDRVLQKAVELGVKRIVPVQSERTEWRGDSVKKHEHWQGVIRSGAMQCGRAVLPELAPVTDFAQAVTQAQGLRWILTPHQESALQTIETVPQMAVWIGCEGGFTPQEVDSALAHGWLPRHLGTRILRADTAAIVALAQAQAQYGDLH